jgi:hypothetical protein
MINIVPSVFIIRPEVSAWPIYCIELGAVKGVTISLVLVYQPLDVEFSLHTVTAPLLLFVADAPATNA